MRYVFIYHSGDISKESVDAIESNIVNGFENVL
jgi:hypothetical protein